ncbi:ubiquitin-like protein Pup [Candidatus Woesearchaeota archaeon]|nr:ubiquitin-like protein Pup [Candidatus Woesearchaeota archaeon]
MYRNSTYDGKGTCGHFAFHEQRDAFPIAGQYSNAAFPLYEAAGQRARPKPRPAKQTQEAKVKTNEQKKDEAKKAKADLDQILEKIDKILDPPSVAQSYKQTSAQ